VTYLLFFLLGFVSCVFFWLLSVRKNNKMMKIHDTVFLQYKRRKDFDREMIANMTNDSIWKYNRIKELEEENTRLRDEKLKAWGIPDGL